jgi:hypothetical protein
LDVIFTTDGLMRADEAMTAAESSVMGPDTGVPVDGTCTGTVTAAWLNVPEALSARTVPVEARTAESSATAATVPTPGPPLERRCDTLAAAAACTLGLGVDHTGAGETAPGDDAAAGEATTGDEDPDVGDHDAVADDAGDDQLRGAAAPRLDAALAASGEAAHPSPGRASGVAQAHRVSGRGSGVGVNRGTSTGWVSSSGSTPPGAGVGSCGSDVIERWSSVLVGGADPEPAPC